MTEATTSHFIHQIIVNDRAAGKHGGRVAGREEFRAFVALAGERVENCRPGLRPGDGERHHDKPQPEPEHRADPRHGHGYFWVLM